MDQEDRFRFGIDVPDEPEYIPVVGDRVSLAFDDEPHPDTNDVNTGVITEVLRIDTGYEIYLRFVVLYDPDSKGARWSIEVALDEIDEVHA